MVDIVGTCATTAADAAPQSLFQAFTVFFGIWVALDSLIAALVVNRKLNEHLSVGGKGTSRAEPNANNVSALRSPI